jgi:GAF domain-containing protein
MPAARSPGDQQETDVAADRPGKPVVLRSSAQLARRFPALGELSDDERTVLVAPMVVDDRRLGVFTLVFPGESPVDEQTQVDFLTTLPAVAGAALDRALREGEGDA